MALHPDHRAPSFSLFLLIFTDLLFTMAIGIGATGIAGAQGKSQTRTPLASRPPYAIRLILTGLRLSFENPSRRWHLLFSRWKLIGLHLAKRSLIRSEGATRKPSKSFLFITEADLSDSDMWQHPTGTTKWMLGILRYQLGTLISFISILEFSIGSRKMKHAWNYWIRWWPGS